MAEQSPSHRNAWKEHPITKALVLSLEAGISQGFLYWLNAGEDPEKRGFVKGLDSVLERIAELSMAEEEED